MSTNASREKQLVFRTVHVPFSELSILIFKMIFLQILGSFLAYLETITTRGYKKCLLETYVFLRLAFSTWASFLLYKDICMACFLKSVCKNQIYCDSFYSKQIHTTMLNKIGHPTRGTNIRDSNIREYIYIAFVVLFRVRENWFPL